MRIFVMAAAGLAAATVAAAGQEAPGRYALQSSPEGFVRLDTRTGSVSHCGERDGVWYCEPFAEQGAAVDARLDRLAAEIAALQDELARLAARLDRPGAAPPGAGVGTLSPEEEKQFDEALGFSEKLMRRFFEMVREMKGQ
ncbi:MAG: hypothetical protein F9K43_11300 [Bauldia sp.]|nr:MAG: hypothetical protein F9K43_11300 [Bauldia sp.]